MPDNFPIAGDNTNAPTTPPPPVTPPQIIFAHANAYVDATTGQVELGARIYADPAKAERRRLSHPVRDDLEFVAIVQVKASIAPSLIEAALVSRRERLAREAEARLTSPVEEETEEITDETEDDNG